MVPLREMRFLPGQWKSVEQLLLQFLELLLTVHLWEFPKLSSLQYLIWKSVALIWAATVVITLFIQGQLLGLGKHFYMVYLLVSLSYDWAGGRSNVDDFTLAAEACLPIIVSVLSEIKRNTYPQNCFLNIEVPTDVRNHQGYRITRQGKSIVKMGWRQVGSDAQGARILSTMTMESNSSSYNESDVLSTPNDHLLFKREVLGFQMDDGDTDYCSLQEGYITVTPLGALSHPEVNSQEYFNEWLPGVAAYLSSAAL